MLFNCYFFLFLFLPLALIGWYALNRMGRLKIAQGYLIGMSLWFYAYFNVSFLWVMLGSCLFNYGLSFLLSSASFTFSFTTNFFSIISSSPAEVIPSYMQDSRYLNPYLLHLDYHRLQMQNS